MSHFANWISPPPPRTFCSGYGPGLVADSVYCVSIYFCGVLKGFCMRRTFMHFRKDFEAQAKICRTIVQYFLKLKEFKDLRTGIVVGKKKQRDIVRAELKYCR